MNRGLFVAAVVFWAGATGAEEAKAEAAAADYRRSPAFEVNVLWPFVPGGIVDFKVLVPVLRANRRDLRGELIFGLHSDFGWEPLSRPVGSYGKVRLLAGKLGYRQFLAYSFHVDLSVNLGWRHEEQNTFDGGTVDGFVGRLWAFGGWQYEFTQRVYANGRGGVGVHLFRTDRFGQYERRFIPAGDLNLGIRF